MSYSIREKLMVTGVLCLAVLLYRSESKLNALEEKFTLLSSSKTNDETKLKTDILNQHPKPAPTSEESRASTPESSFRSVKESPPFKSKVDTSDWFVSEKLKQIESIAVLSGAEREILAAELRPISKANLTSDEVRNVLTRTLGEERANTITSTLIDDAAKEDAKRIDAELLPLSRSLRLSAAQEDAIRNVMVETESALSELQSKVTAKKEEVTALHTAPDRNRDTLRSKFEEMREVMDNLKKQKLDTYQTKFKDILTEEQYNRYLEEASNQ